MTTTEDVSALVGKTVIRAENLRGEPDAHGYVSDADDRVRLEFNDGTVLIVGTSEWLHVTVESPNG